MFKTSQRLLSLLLLAAALALVACGSSSSGDADDAVITGDLTGLTTTSSTATGDFTPSVSAGVGDDGELRLTVTAQDVDGDGTLETPTVTSVAVTTGARTLTDLLLTCDDGREVGAGSSDDSFDIGFSLDTTSSMGDAVEAIATKIGTFATSLAASGVNVEFAGITLGDAFATKLASGSSFTDAISTGPLGVAPDFDTCERPWSGSALTSATDAETFFTEVASVTGSGCGGGDLPENYLGSLQYLNDTATWRTGATRILVAIGDDCSHTPLTYGEAAITDPWIPPAGADLAEALAGIATVHVIGPAAGSCYGDYYDMAGISTATGGTFTEFDCYSADDCNVDLSTLPIAASITEGMVFLCDGSLATYEDDPGSFTFTIDTTVTGSGGTTYNATITLVADLAF